MPLLTLTSSNICYAESSWSVLDSWLFAIEICRSCLTTWYSLMMKNTASYRIYSPLYLYAASNCARSSRYLRDPSFGAIAKRLSNVWASLWKLERRIVRWNSWESASVRAKSRESQLSILHTVRWCFVAILSCGNFCSHRLSSTVKDLGISSGRVTVYVVRALAAAGSKRIFQNWTCLPPLQYHLLFSSHSLSSIPFSIHQSYSFSYSEHVTSYTE